MNPRLEGRRAARRKHLADVGHRHDGHRGQPDAGQDPGGVEHGTFHANAFSSENAEYHTVVTTSARFRPSRSENQPPVVAPTNMPTNAADVIVPMVPSESCHAWRTPGAAKREAVQVAELEEEDVAEQLDHVAMEAGDRQPIEA